MGRILVVIVGASLIFAIAASAAGGSVVAVVGTSLQIPTGWYATVSMTPACDPERLIVVSSAPLRITANGAVRPPARGEVTILLLEDRYRQDRPLGNLQRPAHFSITWNRLVRFKPICGNPNTPAFGRYIKTHSRYLGFIVYPGSQIDANTRSKTLAVMNSLRITT
jgi:hypothetical protein